MPGHADARRPGSHASNPRQQRTSVMNQLVWIVGAVVIILFVLSFFGLR
jgi:type VI protein secretion system component VasF